ncbi:hypothetical protein BKD30_03790 [Tersicoccus phoenicis]|uniref:UPF0182 protein BKD30_03790 n=1 Tax=Tersicoccus phoenicis TaxID=554083 RepID=A0A1R1LHN3_9MICC|nr:UPF0182 family protein [Tersicoccus phoenicis]OMH27027.1 hypothetical protein BKD30_03790 [Tersicoccus phoenicis]
MVPTIIVVAVLVVAVVLLTQVYTDVLWYNQLGYLEVFVKENLTRVGVFLAAALVMAVGVYASMAVAYRSRPVYAPEEGTADNLARYQASFEPVRRLAMIGVPVVFGIFAGTAAASQWQRILLFFNQVPFGQTDPQFGLDYSFYLNTLPFLGFLSGLLISVVLVAGVLGIITHYLYGAIRLHERGVSVARPARVHIAVLAAAFLLLQAANFWLDRYGTLQSTSGLGGRVAGALYTDVNAVIPTKAVLAIAAVIVAVLFVVAAVIGRWRLPLIGTVGLIITAILAGGVYPWVVQRFQVVPSEQTLEQPYIQRNMDMTRKAYGLDAVTSQEYRATTTTSPGALREDAQTTASIRLLDPNLVSAAFSQLEQFRPYYQFSPLLNVDRYQVDGKTQDTVVAVRELRPDNVSGWYNQRIVYTHGYGVVAAAGNRVAADGKPEFLLSGIPSSGVLGSDQTYEPRIYFGENSPEYSIVGAPEGSSPRELDRPQQEGSSQDTFNTFNGDGGPSVGNFFNKLLYSLKFQSSDLLLSDAVNSQSQILYDRNPRDRVQKVAPYLTVDGKPYPAIIDGRVKWIVDGYTTSTFFPYSTQQQLDSLTRDSQTADGRVAALPANNINYIRNSVKATVDAYDGSVDLYAWDDQDPILKAWQKVFPTTLKPYSEMSGQLMSHVRYPEDLFKVQRGLLANYHVTDAVDFYQQNDVWSVPNDPTSSTAVPQPPYYLSLQVPGADRPAFSLTSSFIPQNRAGETPRNVLYGYLSANGDAGNKAGVKSPDYGKLQLLNLPKSGSIPGPGQVQNRFNSDPTVSQTLNLLRQGASNVLNGNLLTLPVGGGMLYVQPVYVQSSGETSYPSLQRVLVGFGEKVGFAATLEEALDQLFGGNSGATAGDSANAGKTPSPPGGSGGTPGTSVSAQAQLKQALTDADAAVKEGQQALAKGDFAAYGTAQKKVSEALGRAIQAENQLGQGGGATASPSPGSSSGPTPSAGPSAAPSATPSP